jgi:hypothetical protein
VTTNALAHPLDALAAEIRSEVHFAERRFMESVEHAIRAGELLLEAKAQLSHGEWLPWLTANFESGVRSAQGYMRLAKNGLEIRKSGAHLGVAGALRVLSAPRVEPEREPLDELERLAAFELIVEREQPATGDPQDALADLARRLGAATTISEMVAIRREAAQWTIWAQKKALRAERELGRVLNEMAVEPQRTGGAS